jgi:glyoxylase-like metal-dependent hydrolase (beta-lactamase superfamily II)
VATLVTPPFTSMRFDTTFYAAELPPGQRAEVWPGELDEGRWSTAEGLLREWAEGRCLVSPPTVSILEAVRGKPPREAAERLAPLLASLAAGDVVPIYFAPRVRLIPLKTVALPPGDHTNAFLVGSDPAYLIDPGPRDPAERQRLFSVLDAFQAEGGRLAAVVLTHHHPDHADAAAACCERYGVPAWAHPWTAAALRAKLAVRRELNEGDRLDLGRTPGGGGPWHLEAHHTPGHAPGHLAFYDPHFRLLFAGDMVSTLSSIIIAPPDGDLTAYLASLRRLQRLDCRLLLPGHGNASSQPGQTLEECLAHRAKREEQLVAALQAGARSVAELIPELYRGLPSSLTRLAELQTLAGLQKLQKEGRAEPDEAGAGRWRLV